MTYVLVVADLLDGGIIERSGVGGERVDLVVALNAGVRAALDAGDVALVDAGGPGGVGGDLGGVGALLEGDDVLARDLLARPADVRLGHGGTEDGRNDRSQEEQRALDGIHDHELDRPERTLTCKVVERTREAGWRMRMEGKKES